MSMIQREMYIVEGRDQQPHHGKWILVSNYHDNSVTNIENIWEQLKARIESGELSVIKMECPAPSRKGLPEIHISTSQTHVAKVGCEIISIVKQDIQYMIGDGNIKKVLHWNDGNINDKDLLSE